MDTGELVRTIQYVLAPAVMVSSSALLLLGFQTKFSNLANRFRALNQEKRLLSERSDRSPSEEARFRSLGKQVEQLMRRATLVKRAILLTYGAIVCFAGTSVFIFLNVYTSFQLYHLIIAVFIFGFFLSLAAAVFMIQETSLFYRIIRLEKSS